MVDVRSDFVLDVEQKLLFCKETPPFLLNQKNLYDFLTSATPSQPTVTYVDLRCVSMWKCFWL